MNLIIVLVLMYHSPPIQILHCPINGYMTSLSVHALCSGKRLCDNGFDDMCKRTSSTCYVHKHFLCNGNNHLISFTVHFWKLNMKSLFLNVYLGKYDCKDKSDETCPTCSIMSKVKCHRMIQHPSALRVPISWVKDGVSK